MKIRKRNKIQTYSKMLPKQNLKKKEVSLETKQE
jgi:hypothetical protein